MSSKTPKMKKIALIVGCIVIANMTHAQSLKDAQLKTADERYEEAADEFHKLIQKTPESVDNYFYLAENYLLMEKPDSSKFYWGKAAQGDEKNPLSIVAKGKLLWISNQTDQAIETFEHAIKVSKKRDGEVFRQIGAIMFQSKHKDYDKAISYLRRGIEVDKNNVDGYLLLGDAIIEKDPRNGTDAIREYNNAEKIQKSAKTIVRKAQLYQRAKNYQLANEMFQQAQELEPNYAPVYRAHANLLELFGKYDAAIKNWEKYLQLNDNNYTRYLYAAALYNAERPCDALKEAQNLEAKNYTSIYIRRIDYYSNFDCLEQAKSNDTIQYQKGLKSLTELIKQYEGTEDISGTDYKYQAGYFNKLGMYDDAEKAYFRAAEDSTIANEIYGLLAHTFSKNKKYDEAIKAYNKIIEKDSSALELADYYDLGRIYFLNKDYVNSDNANAYVLKLSPTYSFSFFWRGRANVYLDIAREEKGEPKTWSAKEYYQGYLNNTTDVEKTTYKSMTIEAYKYLGDYYINSPEKDIEKAKEVWTKIVELDPTNTTYQEVLNKLKK